MAVYRAMRPRAFIETFDGNLLNGEIIVRERQPIDTGLIDQHGTPIYRIESPQPFGFTVPHRKAS